MKKESLCVSCKQNDCILVNEIYFVDLGGCSQSKVCDIALAGECSLLNQCLFSKGFEFPKCYYFSDNSEDNLELL